MDRHAAAPAAPCAPDGEPEAADSLRQAIEERYRWGCSVPEYLELAQL